MLEISADLQAQLSRIAEDAARACGAPYASVRLVDGDEARVVADFTPLPTREEPIRIAPGGGAWRAIHDLEIVHHDIAEGSESGRRVAERDGWRTTLMVPLRSGGSALGYITLRRAAVEPFSNAQIALLETFAEVAATALRDAKLP